ncbi:hypothetical protein [Coleofasciculus sp. FACHB-SPT36]|uniref:hypothetical protein n=3 Tax=Cyanophyceae TaxID=3028117 RepID=UPI00168BC712|nr:hypothetical protein [Coleofasciculus sp. FACHB-SPT36]MBD2539086.1 hypothetical protein [Coleofasciculus sp. FACHB-SPT36]
MMARKSIEGFYENSLSQVQAELLEALLQPEEAPYPWNPADPNVEAYWTELEQEFELEGWLDEEISRGSQALYAKFDECWANTNVAVVPTAAIAVTSSLSERFAARVPQAWLDAIAHKAQQVVSSPLSIADQMVQCVQELLPEWGEDVLQVWARPLASAMRGSEAEIARPVEWDELSESERARLSLAVARYALRQFNDLNSSAQNKSPE